MSETICEIECPKCKGVKQLDHVPESEHEDWEQIKDGVIKLSQLCGVCRLKLIGKVQAVCIASGTMELHEFRLLVDDLQEFIGRR